MPERIIARTVGAAGTPPTDMATASRPVFGPLPSPLPGQRTEADCAMKAGTDTADMRKGTEICTETSLHPKSAAPDKVQPARRLGELSSLILGVTATAQGSGTPPETADLTETATGIIAATATPVGRPLRAIEVTAETLQIASVTGMTTMTTLPLKVNSH